MISGRQQQVGAVLAHQMDEQHRRHGGRRSLEQRGLPLDRALDDIGPVAAVIGARQPCQQFARGCGGGRRCTVEQVARASRQVAGLAVVEAFAIDVKALDQALGQVVRGFEPLQLTGRSVQFEEAEPDLRVIG